MGGNGSTNCAIQESDYHFVFNASDPTPRNNLVGQGISFAAVEIPTSDEPTKEQGFGPFGLPVTWFDTSGGFSGSGGTNSEETEGSTFEVEEGPVQRVGLWSYIIDILKTLARALVMVVLLHYVWPTFGSLYMTNTNGQAKTFYDITTAETGWHLRQDQLQKRGPDIGRDLASVK